jgi:hypothetical protein
MSVGSAYVSDPKMLVLHGLKLKGFSQPEAVERVTGLPEAQISPILATAAEQGLALFRETKVLSGWMLTAPGKAEHATLLAAEMAEARQLDTVKAAYEAFLPLNALLLQVCTDWQVSDLATNQLNDHDDPGYDAAVIKRLGDIHADAIPICASLSAAFSRYAPYRGRFELALERLRSGLNEWFTKPILDSYHTVWMELHEDLLATLAIDRASEGH